MNKVLVTGGGDILDYHVIKCLKEHGIDDLRWLVLPGSETKYIKRFLKVDPMGEITNPSDLEAALQGVDTVVHMAYEVDPSKTREDMYEVNVAGTQKLLDGAEAAGVPRVVASSSALTLGVHRDPVPLDEEAEWAIHGIDLDYVESRREAEQLALSRSRPGFEVVVVAPALTIGPEDFGPAPGGKIIKRVVEGRFVPTFDVGVGCVDARDFADGVLLAAERGRPGQRYVLCAHNPTLKDLVAEVAAVAGTRARTWHLPRFLPRVLVAVLVFWSRIRGKKEPPPIAKLGQLIGRHGWYDARRMREDLGWRPKPLHETLVDTVQWFRENPKP
jgi:dihydroflavonol-4-reductase